MAPVKLQRQYEYHRGFIKKLSRATASFCVIAGKFALFFAVDQETQQG